LEHNRNLLNSPDCGASSNGGGIKYRLANAVVFQKVKAALGLNKCERLYAAAAPMAKELLEYFLSLDLRILEIYGMSEVSNKNGSGLLKEQTLTSHSQCSSRRSPAPSCPTPTRTEELAPSEENWPVNTLLCSFAPTLQFKQFKYVYFS
jgi:hypothetical protein